MMLHEAVMLEIYRQALNASELASPRCHSRESNNSNTAADVRCPSNDSHCSGNENVTPTATPLRTTPPVGLPLPATLAPAAAAALLPPQSAMAAYLNAAAAAAQQNHLLLTNPLAAAASFVQQATQAHSPTVADIKRTPNSSPHISEAPALDFSTKHSCRGSETGSNDDEDVEEDDKNQNNSIDNDDEADENENSLADDVNAPLDLSLGTTRKRQTDEDEVTLRKTPRLSDYKPLPPGSWVPPINPYLAAVAAASLSPKTDCWNNKAKYAPNEATKALEKMTEMTRLGAATATTTTTSTNEIIRSTTQSTAVTTTSTNNSNGRHSAWQSHWLTKGADAVKDVFKCVWCKQSFPTLATLTVHMKETQHCGVNVPAAVAAGAANGNANSSSVSANSHHPTRHSNREVSANGNNGSSNTSSSNAAGLTSTSKSDLSLLIKETMPLPRKLVRGQDVWLGKGAEQTRQILKCMWCGQSFRSLAEMTSHMQETQHYTNIISQEQIISWKSSDEKGSSIAGGNAARESAINTAGMAVNTAVSAVLTCKVCDQAFPTLKELSNHMVKNSHYKEHIIRTAPNTAATDTNPINASSPTSSVSRGRGGRQGRGEKRKKSLPVRKLLELERAQHDYKCSNNSLDSALKPLRDFAASTKITCEKCGDKIETALFVDHIRLCLGGHIPMSPRHNNINNNNINSSLKGSYTEASSREQTPHSNQSVDGRKTADMELTSPLTGSSRSEILCPLPKDGEKLTSSTTPSVLNAIEQLIEKSFDTRVRSSAGSSSYGVSSGTSSKPNTPLGSSILKRLGIEDSVDYTKPLMDAQTINFLRSYSNYTAQRDRSASESSSVSERCSSRLESSITPERTAELSRQATPRLLTPEKLSTSTMEIASKQEIAKIKSEPVATDDEQLAENLEPMQKISVKKEFSMPEVNEQDQELDAASPITSERSITPKSNASYREQKSPKISQAIGGSSLTALSSMFDNLNNRNSSSGGILIAETNNNHAGNKKSSANPLAALQKLCETTSEATTANARGNNLNQANANGAGLGNMVAFSWACNDGVLTSPDASIKCSYCDTPFSSKGAYRHHLCKVHFIKDENCETNSLKSPGIVASPKSTAAASPKHCISKSPISQRHSVSPANSVSTTPIINPYDESPQSKFLKYTELAKQLSSKNA